MLRLNKHTWSPHAARLSPYTVAVHWQTPGNVSENSVLGRENSFSISAHTPSHHCALQVGTSGEQPVLHYSPSLPTASPPEKATENEDLRECEVIKGSRAEDSKPQKPGTSLLPLPFPGTWTCRVAPTCTQLLPATSHNRAQAPHAFSVTSQGNALVCLFLHNTQKEMNDTTVVQAPVGSSRCSVKPWCGQICAPLLTSTYHTPAK